MLIALLAQGFVFLLDPFAAKGSLFSFTPSSCEICGEPFRVCGVDPVLCPKKKALRMKAQEDSIVATGFEEVD